MGRSSMTDHRFTRRLVGIVGTVGIVVMAVSSLVYGHDGDILVSAILAVVAVVTVALKGISD